METIKFLTYFFSKYSMQLVGDFNIKVVVDGGIRVGMGQSKHNCRASDPTDMGNQVFLIIVIIIIFFCLFLLENKWKWLWNNHSSKEMSHEPLPQIRPVETWKIRWKWLCNNHSSEEMSNGEIPQIRPAGIC